jgi:VanZ family protein
MPADLIGTLRHRWWWFTYPLDHIESVHSAVNLVHAILFLILGIASRLALPSWRVGRVALTLVLLGIATELVQILVPGRHSRLTDAVVDVVAGMLGWAAMRGLVR